MKGNYDSRWLQRLRDRQRALMAMETTSPAQERLRQLFLAEYSAQIAEAIGQDEERHKEAARYRADMADERRRKMLRAIARREEIGRRDMNIAGGAIQSYLVNRYDMDIADMARWEAMEDEHDERRDEYDE